VTLFDVFSCTIIFSNVVAHLLIILYIDLIVSNTFVYLFNYFIKK